ncbi:unnamed protein product, partial [Musa textilis]
RSRPQPSGRGDSLAGAHRAQASLARDAGSAAWLLGGRLEVVLASPSYAGRPPSGNTAWIREGS